MPYRPVVFVLDVPSPQSYSPHTELEITVRKLLEQCPGEPLCDACLAFACSVSLGEMRAVTTVIDDAEPFTRATAMCASCRRQTPTLVSGTLPSRKCTHCSAPIDPDEPVEIVDTDRFHRRCWTRLTSAESVRSARALSRRSQELIRKSRELIGLRPVQEPPAQP
jgi:hypothetical protein